MKLPFWSLAAKLRSEVPMVGANRFSYAHLRSGATRLAGPLLRTCLQEPVAAVAAACRSILARRSAIAKYLQPHGGRLSRVCPDPAGENRRGSPGATVNEPTPLKRRKLVRWSSDLRRFGTHPAPLVEAQCPAQVGRGHGVAIDALQCEFDDAIGLPQQRRQLI